MIRRKIWATMTCCLALAGAGRAQTDSPAKASLGKPQAGPNSPGYVARGAAPSMPGYPQGYPMPAPTYSAPVPPAGTVTGFAPAYVPNGTVPQYVPAGTVQQYVPTVNVQYYNSAPVRPAGFASMQNPTPVGPAPAINPTPMQMPASPNPVPGTVTAPPAMLHPPVESGPVTTVPSYSVPGTSPNMSYGSPPTEGTFGSPYYGSVPGVTDCAPNCGPNCPLPTVWIAPEYINWNTKGSGTPPLVSTAPVGSLGQLGQSTTRVLFGGADVNDSWRSGFRVRGGIWLDKCEGCGIDLGYTWLALGRERFNADSLGDPGLFRPFRTPGGTEDAQLVSFINTNPNAGALGTVITGRIAVEATTELQGAEANLRKVLWCDPCGRTDLLVGFRYQRLRDTVTVFEDLTVPGANGLLDATRIQIQDRFETTNDFYGGQIGLAGEKRYGNFIFGYRSTVALGITHQKTKINGYTSTKEVDTPLATTQGGLLALPTNIGSYTADRFTVIPDVQLTLGYQLTNNLRVFGGYNFMYWTNVLRAGEQIDRTVNANFLPNNTDADANTGAKRPGYIRNDASFWAHGWSAGFEFRW